MQTDYSGETSILKYMCGILNSPGNVIKCRESFRPASAFTEFVSILVDELAVKMRMLHYHGNKKCDYYSIDHVLYRDEDQLQEGTLPFKTGIVYGCWLKRIRVAIEHENRLSGKRGGFQEITHLMLVNADIKILLGYASVS